MILCFLFVNIGKVVILIFERAGMVVTCDISIGLWRFGDSGNVLQDFQIKSWEQNVCACAYLD